MTPFAFKNSLKHFCLVWFIPKYYNKTFSNWLLLWRLFQKRVVRSKFDIYVFVLFYIRKVLLFRVPMTGKIRYYRDGCFSYLLISTIFLWNMFFTKLQDTVRTGQKWTFVRGCSKTEDTKGIIRIRISKRNRQHNDQKDKQWSTKHTYKTKDRVKRTPLKTGGELSCSERVSSSCSTSDTRRVDGFSSFSLIVICFIFLLEWSLQIMKACKRECFFSIISQ